jgi:hypothetical protein
MSVLRQPRGEYPDTYPCRRGDEEHRVAVVVGSAPCVDDDLIQVDVLADASGVQSDAVAVNRAAIDTVRHVEHWVAIEGVKLSAWLDERRAKGWPDPPHVVGVFIGAQQDPRITWWQVHPYPGKSGSSSLFAVRWALYCGYRRIVLCGVPLTGVGPCGDYARFRAGWETNLDTWPLRECVRSMSGWTRELLGAPDDEFLRG